MDQPTGSLHPAKNPNQRAFWETQRVRQQVKARRSAHFGTASQIIPKGKNTEAFPGSPTVPQKEKGQKSLSRAMAWGRRMFPRVVSGGSSLLAGRFCRRRQKTLPTAFRTPPDDKKPMASNLKIVFLGYPRTQPGNLLTVELDQPIATLAIQMIMLGIAVVMFIDIPAAQGHFFQQASFAQLCQSAIDGWPRNLPTGDHLLEMFEEFFGIEVVMVAEHLFNNQSPLHRQPFAPSP
jgi:hypothetical protein